LVERTLIGEIAPNVHILYGGSIKPENIYGLISEPDIDGGLIGGASLKIEDFCKNVDIAVDLINSGSKSMIDLKYIRTHPQEVRNAILNKNEKANLDAILALDENRRKLQYEYDQLRSKQHQVSQIIVLKKRNGEDVSELLAEMSEVAEQIRALNAQLTETNTHKKICC
jgi:hypothetical protein